MEALEKKVQQLLLAGSQQDTQEKARTEELVPLMTEIDKIKDSYSETLKVLSAKIIRLKEEILEAMTEKTYKFKCATIQKRTTPKLQVLDGLKLFRQLDAKECIDSVKFLFNDKQVRTLIEGGAIKTGKACEITTTESLAITLPK